MEKNPQNQKRLGILVTSRWKAGLLLMEMVLTDLQIPRALPTRQASCVLAETPETLGRVLVDVGSPFSYGC